MKTQTMTNRDAVERHSPPSLEAEFVDQPDGEFRALERLADRLPKIIIGLAVLALVIATLWRSALAG